MAYHKIDNDSVNSITSALDFFHIPPTNVSVSSSKVYEILTSNPITDIPWHFKVHSSQDYVDLSKCYIFTEFRIKKEQSGAWVDLAGTENVAPIELIGQTFINNMQININGREIYNSNSLQAYKAYLSHELSFSPIAKLSHLNAAGYFHFSQATDLEAGENFKKSMEKFAKSTTVQCIAKINADLFMVPQYLVNHTDIDITILPNDSKFLLISNEDNPKYKLEVVSCKLYVRKMTLMDVLDLDIARKITAQPARYAIRKGMMKSMFISEGRYEYNAAIFMDQIPRRVTLGLVANENYVGNWKKSPFNFQPFDVKEISLVANGRQYPQAPYDLDYENGKYVRAFNDMNEAIGFTNTMEGNGISYAQFGKTHCVYVFNLTNSGDSQAGLFDLIKSGTTMVNIRFAKKVPAGGIVLIVMGEADSIIMIDKNRSLSSDTTI